MNLTLRRQIFEEKKEELTFFHSRGGFGHTLLSTLQGQLPGPPPCLRQPPPGGEKLFRIGLTKKALLLLYLYNFICICTILFVFVQFYLHMRSTKVEYSSLYTCI